MNSTHHSRYRCEAEKETWQQNFENFFENAEDFIEDNVDLQGAFSVGVFVDDDGDITSVGASA